MDIIKYFYEEPASLEVLPPDTAPEARRPAGPALSLEAFLRGPAYYRGYLAGSDLARRRIGLTAIGAPEAYLMPLLNIFAGQTWSHGLSSGDSETLDEEAVRRVLRHPDRTRILAAGDQPIPGEALQAAAGTEHRLRLAALRELLERAHVVLYPEPAHQGFDWSLFATTPLHEKLARAFQRHVSGATRYFVIPYQAARSEEKFYFEQYDLARFAAYELR